MKCPRCGKLTDISENPFRPFCSERCKLVDLGNWVSEAYRIAGEDAAHDEDSPPIHRKDSDQE